MSSHGYAIHGPPAGRLLEQPQIEVVLGEFLANLDQTGLTEVLHTHQLRLGTRCQIPDRLDPKLLERLAGTHGELESRNRLVEDVVRGLASQFVVDLLANFVFLGIVILASPIDSLSLAYRNSGSFKKL